MLQLNVVIPAKTGVFINVCAIERNSEFRKNPEASDPEKFVGSITAQLTSTGRISSCYLKWLEDEGTQ